MVSIILKYNISVFLAIRLLFCDEVDVDVVSSNLFKIMFQLNFNSTIYKHSHHPLLSYSSNQLSALRVVE